jgi:hypothetical protein
MSIIKMHKKAKSEKRIVTLGTGYVDVSPVTYWELNTIESSRESPSHPIEAK